MLLHHWTNHKKYPTIELFKTALVGFQQKTRWVPWPIMLRIMVFLFHFVLSRFETGEHRGESCCHPSGTPRVIREKMIKSFAPKAIAKHQSSNANIALCYFISFNALEPSCLINCKIFFMDTLASISAPATHYLRNFICQTSEIAWKKEIGRTYSVDRYTLCKASCFRAVQNNMAQRNV